MKMKKKYVKWSLYERSLIVAHNRRFGVANIELLCEKMPWRSWSSVKCELSKFDAWIRTGIMEFKPSQRHINDRAGVREIYTKIIQDLF